MTRPEQTAEGWAVAFVPSTAIMIGLTIYTWATLSRNTYGPI